MMMTVMTKPFAGTNVGLIVRDIILLCGLHKIVYRPTTIHNLFFCSKIGLNYGNFRNVFAIMA